KIQNSVLLFGGKNNVDLPGLGDFKALGIGIKVSTEDGTMGAKGLVTMLLKRELSRSTPAVIYACGPNGMLRAVARLAEERDITCYVSLDRVMACGIGACLGCAVKIRGEGTKDYQSFVVRGQFADPRSPIPEPIYKMVCKDGPVFDAKEITWEEI
ncbi:MAG: hypothetical protein HY878_06135, partial [Deltaproteobacteria bacterium]|nr:hypothetical protein [Deltaproteobacteria bacterium]